jgi:hypothetical protein
MVGAKFSENGWDSLMPVRGKTINEFLSYDDKNNIMIRPFHNKPKVYGGDRNIYELNNEVDEQGDMVMRPISSILGDP